MRCLDLYLSKCLLFLLLGFTMSQNAYSQVYYRTDNNYYVYGESTPVLKNIREIAIYYNMSIESIVEGDNNHSSGFWEKKQFFRDTIYSLKEEFLKENSWLSDSPKMDGFLDKMLKYQYAYLFPLEKGDTIWLSFGKIKTINRTTYFEAWDNLFEKRNRQMIQDTLIGNYLSFDINDLEKIPYQYWECVADTIQDNTFIDGYVAFKFDFNAEITAYFVKVDYFKPFSCYLYLFRNSDKKMIGEKPILVYYREELTPCRYRTDTKITDYNKDGHLDLIIYQKEECVRREGSSSSYNYRILLWDKDKHNFFIEYESKEENESKGWIENETEVEKGFGEMR